MSATPLSQLFVTAWAEGRALVTDVAALVKAQLHQDGGRVAAGSGALVGALIFAAGIPPLLILALVWGIVAMGLSPWAAYLIVAGVGALVAVVLVLIGRGVLRGAVRSSKQTVEHVKSSLSALSGSLTAGSGSSAPGGSQETP